MQRGLVGSEMCIRDRVSTQSTWDTKFRKPSMGRKHPRPLRTDYNEYVDELFKEKPHKQKEERQLVERNKVSKAQSELRKEPLPAPSLSSLPIPTELPDFPQASHKRKKPEQPEDDFNLLDQLPNQEEEGMTFPPLIAFDSISRLDFQPAFMRGDSVFSLGPQEETAPAAFPGTMGWEFKP
eukprot:TRINITY_DN12674_c0_g1_i3.p2 TRINITY_DN12674_c0_g1~~TRINITY_DN12674_c0_g1_i3.p2  ORF type:complete len:181 (-),score=35.76 TRINITY_DN12674_c0_g1_i3:135-677(-)